jgi:exopolysaccharide biosynthesis polyprenyl glycosylphosphotransferase
MKNTLSRESYNNYRSAINSRTLDHAKMIIYQFWLVIQDFILIYLGFQAAYYLRFLANFPFFADSVIPQISRYRDFMFISIPIWVMIFAFMGLYSSRNLLGGTKEYSLLVNATSMGMLLIISAGFLMPEGLILARGWVILAWLLSLLFTGVGRFLARRVIYLLRRNGHFKTPAIIVGANQEGQLLVEQFLGCPTSGIHLVGYVDGDQNHALDGKLKRLGDLKDLDYLVDKYEIGDIILTSSALTQEQVLALFRKYGMDKDVNLRMSSGLYEIITTGMRVTEEGLVPLVNINKVRMTGFDQALKQIMDYLIAIPTTLCLSPIFAIIAVVIKLDSPGPVIYRRRVGGVNGKQFDAFKFRTMRADSDDILNAHPEWEKEYKENYKLKNDPRVTRVGKFLRKASMDELPQFINVLRNEMSIVGPRMITPEELNKYGQWDINLLTVKPGITGMWQVRGRSNVGYEERVTLDMYYIRNWTVWLDLHLLLQTIPAVLSKRGAY